MYIFVNQVIGTKSNTIIAISNIDLESELEAVQYP